MYIYTDIYVYVCAKTAVKVPRRSPSGAGASRRGASLPPRAPCARVEGLVSRVWELGFRVWGRPALPATTLYWNPSRF